LRILIADDQKHARSGLKALLSASMHEPEIWEAANGREAERIAEEVRPDLVLMDVRMPGMDGVEATARIHEGRPATRIVMLTTSSLGEDVFNALRNGAHGYVIKDEPAERLHAYLEAVMRGEVALSSAIAGRVLAQLSVVNSRAPAPVTVLTSREREVLRQLVEGQSNEEIAVSLNVSEATVKKHLGRVMTKLHLDNRVQLAVYSVREGLVD